MNLFFLSWRLPPEHREGALTALRNVSRIYPQLDPATLWHYHAGAEVFAASIHTALSAAAPRSYVFRNDKQVIFYDGLMVDINGRFSAHRAEELNSNWNQLTESLEGRFVVVRLQDNPASIELLIDPLGLEQVYYLRQDDAWLLSNSVSVLEQLGPCKELDSLGVSLWLAIEWVAADRTLVKDIRVLPGGHRLVWRREFSLPSYEAYYPRPALAKRKRSVESKITRRLADDLIQICSELSRNFGKLNCPLSGGKDSRVVASLLIHGNIPARYRTDGDPGCTDVFIAKQIAEAFSLDYDKSKITTNEVTARWDDLIPPFVRRTGGLLSIIILGTFSEHPATFERLPVRLPGLGGEIARCYYGDYYLFTHGFTRKRMIEYFPDQIFPDFQGIINGQAVQLARDHIRAVVQSYIDEGFDPLDVPDVFYIYERLHRGVANLFWERSPTEDYFAPMCTRPFVEATFSLSPLRRYAEPLHYQLVRELEPRLFSIPLDKPWRSQQHPSIQIAKYVKQWVWEKTVKSLGTMDHSRGVPHIVTMSDPPTWLEAKRVQIRDLCLSYSDSPIWDFVNRPVFERLMSTARPEERRQRMRLLFAIATMFYYEKLRKEAGPISN